MNIYNLLYYMYFLKAIISKSIISKQNNYFRGFSNLYKPKTLNHQKYVDSIQNDNIKLIFGVGPAGCGKTLFACINAVQMLKNNKIDKIILTRPFVSVEEEIGYLPGDVNKKMDPYTKPLFDVFNEFYKKQEIDQMIHNNIIEIVPIGYMRGRTFKNAYIIADEMQNSSPSQMKMITTRIGENTKMIVTGDLQQSDLKGTNGLCDFLEKYKKFINYNNFEIDIIEFDNYDIERSSIVKTILNIYK